VQVSKAGVTTHFIYNGLGDRLVENEMQFVMDLNAGLTQALSDGTNNYLYGNGRIGQFAGVETAYFLGDALGSVRQLVDDSGLVSLVKSYEPYGEMVSSVGESSSAYGYTGEWSSTSLLYLRARWYSSQHERFISKDTWQGLYKQTMTYNAWLYSLSNPINYTDPSGMYSIRQIAESYGVNVSNLFIGLRYGGYASINEDSGLKGRWGWIKLLLDAKDGQSVYIGNPALFPPYLDTNNSGISRFENGKIRIGNKGLREYTSFDLNTPMGPFFWRNMKPNHYFLNNKEYLDDKTRGDLPDFRVLNADLLFLLEGVHPALGILSQVFDLGGSVIIDRNGNVYISPFGNLAPNIGGQPLSIGEGYVSRNPQDISSQITNNGNIPGEQDIIDTITGLCGNVSGSLLTGTVQATLCTNHATAIVFGYTISLAGDSVGASFGIGPLKKFPRLAWNYIDTKPGITEADVRREIELQEAISPCK
jgi:RHS repeat-associated protein